MIVRKKWIGLLILALLFALSGLAEAPTRDRKREQITGTPDQIAQKLVAIINNTV